MDRYPVRTGPGCDLAAGDGEVSGNLRLRGQDQGIRLRGNMFIHDLDEAAEVPEGIDFRQVDVLRIHQGVRHAFLERVFGGQRHGLRIFQRRGRRNGTGRRTDAREVAAEGGDGRAGPVRKRQHPGSGIRQDRHRIRGTP